VAAWYVTLQDLESSEPPSHVYLGIAWWKTIPGIHQGTTNALILKITNNWADK